MRVAVIGCGYWGSKHVRVASGLADVTSVVAVDPRPDRLASLTKSFPALTTFPSVEQALPHIDAAIVATPPRTHALLGQLLIEHGKHALLEKPMATSTAEATALVEAADRAGVVLMAGHTFQYNPAVERLREAVSTRELGAIHYADAARLNLGLYQSDVNVIWDLAPHDISILNYVLDSEPTYVHAWGGRHAHPRLHDVAYVRLEYEAVGVSAQIHVSWLDPCKVRRVTVVGHERMAVYNDLASEERVRVYDRGVSAAEADDDLLHEVPMSYRYGGIYSPAIPAREPLEAMDSHFVECITTGRVPLSDGRSGLSVVRVLEAAEQSLYEQQGIALEQPLTAVCAS